MKQTKPDTVQLETRKLFEATRVRWDVSKEDVFANTFEALLAEEERPVKTFRLPVRQLSIAASLALMLATSLFALFYTKTVTSPAGTHLTAQLPDNSTVEMNAASTLSYHPYRWYFSRKVTFEGEGFFSVEKGKSFTVSSKLGQTRVYGTSFNIYARDNDYRVFCKTGKVGVKNLQGEEVILTPNQSATLNNGKLVKESRVATPENILAWRNNFFTFSAAPFRQVLNEIERQYNITISTGNLGNQTLSVSFKKEPEVEKVLTMVCKPLGFEFVRQNEKTFIIKEAAKQ